jgi:hypothetical protein
MHRRWTASRTNANVNVETQLSGDLVDSSMEAIITYRLQLFVVREGNVYGTAIEIME